MSCSRSSKFDRKVEERRAELVAEGKGDYVDVVEFYPCGMFSTWSEQETTRQGCPEGECGGAHHFYTPKCVVNLIAKMIEPFKSKIYDPCCGSAAVCLARLCVCASHKTRFRATFASLKFVESHHGNTKDISVYGRSRPPPPTSCE